VTFGVAGAALGEGISAAHRIPSDRVHAAAGAIAAGDLGAVLGAAVTLQAHSPNTQIGAFVLLTRAYSIS
jgi:hypothetical protein